MEKRNTILLTVIAIATLLVSVVGATFAYFVASTQTDGAGSSANTTTQKMNGANLNFVTTGEVLNKLEYPGGLGIYGATATISKQDDNGDNNDYEATFDIEITYTNPTGTNLEWELWVLDKNLNDLSYSDGKSLSDVTTCELKSATVGSDNYYWYADHNDSGTYSSGDRCDAEAIRTAVKNDDGKLIAYGDFTAKTNDSKTINKQTTCQDGTEIKCNESLSTSDTDLDNLKKAITSNQLGDRKLNTNNLKSKVYYLVVKYPNNNSDQSDNDAGKQISVTLKLGEGANSVLYTPED